MMSPLAQDAGLGPTRVVGVSGARARVDPDNTGSNTAPMRYALLVVLLGCDGREPIAKGKGQQPNAVRATAAFVDVTVVPMTDEREVAHQTVLIDDATIVAIGPVGTTIVPAHAKKIEGAGRWLVPGLADMHVHFNNEGDGLLYLANGVTTVRNLWGAPQQL